MKHNEIDRAIAILEKNSQTKLAEKLNDAQTIGATGGEVITNLAIIFQEIKHNQPMIYELIASEANIFFEKYNSHLY